MFDISNYCLFSIRVNEGYVKNSNKKKKHSGQCQNLCLIVHENSVET